MKADSSRTIRVAETRIGTSTSKVYKGLGNGAVPLDGATKPEPLADCACTFEIVNPSIENEATIGVTKAAPQSEPHERPALALVDPGQSLFLLALLSHGVLPAPVPHILARIPLCPSPYKRDLAAAHFFWPCAAFRQQFKQVPH